LGGVDGFGGEFEGLGYEVLDGGCVEEGGRFEDDVAGLFAAAGEEALWIAEAGAALEEEEADPAGEERDGEDGIGGALGGAETDGEGVVVVVDEFVCSRKTGAHFAQRCAGLGCDFGGELVEESIQLGGGVQLRGGRFFPGGLFLRGAGGGSLFWRCGLARRHGGPIVAACSRPAGTPVLRFDCLIWVRGACGYRSCRRRCRRRVGRSGCY